MTKMKIKNKLIRRIIDYAIDTTICNFVVAVIVIPYYIVLGMDWESLKMVIFAFLTIGWVQSFPIPIVLRWFRRKMPYLEVGEKSNIAD